MATLVFAPTMDQTQPGDMIGLNIHMTPARRDDAVCYYREVLAVEQLPGDRTRLTVAFNAGPVTMTMGNAVPVSLWRGGLPEHLARYAL